jgi:hypothetical protein
MFGFLLSFFFFSFPSSIIAKVTHIMKAYLLLALTGLVALDTVSGQAPVSGAPIYVPQNNFPWKNKFPTPLSVPEIKPEWIKLVDNTTVSQAPVNVKGPDGSLLVPPPGSNDTYCHWSFYQCLKPTDIASCPKGDWAPVCRFCINEGGGDTNALKFL